MEEKLEYGRTYGRLILETAIVAFMKANGAIRLMLCTRNLDTAKLLGGENNLEYGLSGFDGRCNIGNGNVAVIDLAIGECRSFNVDRVITIKWLGEIDSIEAFDKAVEEYEEALESLREQGMEIEEAGHREAVRQQVGGEMPAVSF